MHNTYTYICSKTIAPFIRMYKLTRTSFPFPCIDDDGGWWRLSNSSIRHKWMTYWPSKIPLIRSWNKTTGSAALELFLWTPSSFIYREQAGAIEAERESPTLVLDASSLYGPPFRNPLLAELPLL